ncbi:MAG TPA: 1,2-phenylacetyl-CoA epoxidase subunit PaaE [Chitinophagaceae bacterium]|nr:1,2-phenylacetyl-CoA epoxidase subunit PaaE [Chitinophagaceae bacterium]
MSIHFHPLTVKEVKKETSECVSVLFDVPEALKKSFSFTHGQSLTMRVNINGTEVRRTYSICSSPFEKELRIAIKKVGGGLFSTYANEQLKKGDVLDVMEPVGKFNTPLFPSQKKKYVAFAAGSGITPVLSIIKTTLQTEPESIFTLVYGNQSRGSVIFFEELEGIKNKYIDRFNLIHIFSREKTDTELNFGRISENKLKELKKLVEYKTIDEFFLCGPEEMIFCVKNFLETGGIDKEKIHFELFASSGQKTILNKKQVVETSSVQSNITIKLDGRTLHFNLPLNSKTTILDGALKQGADLPYACKGGMCCTCKAKLLEGKVSMDVHWGLEDDEVKKGYILTCQSHPQTETVVVDFDLR